MVGVPWHIAEHKLNVSENAKPVVQTKCRLGSEKHEAMQEQVTELLNAGIIRALPDLGCQPSNGTKGK